MKPVVLHTERLVLDQPTLDDADLVTVYCQDPVFETYMVTPWPYVRGDAEVFLGRLVPRWWDEESEFTWALRLDGELIGVIGYRTGGKDIGFWLGGPHRGRGYMPEAVSAVLDWVFTLTNDDVLWECFPGNVASAGVARKCGFRFQGVGKSIFTDRRGDHPTTWKATIAETDSREPKPGWPEPDRPKD
jgi:RimJ/RimL family protein N-acetyltransferase